MYSPLFALLTNGQHRIYSYAEEDAFIGTMRDRASSGMSYLFDMIPSATVLALEKNSDAKCSTASDQKGPHLSLRPPITCKCRW